MEKAKGSKFGKKSTYIQFLPILGIIGFMCFYLIAVNYYPGGSFVDESSVGFDWKYNYWCNLYYKNAINGEVNPSRGFAIIGMYILCASLLFFFYEFPLYFDLRKTWNKIIPFAGISSMICTVFIYTNYHDVLTTLAGLFGIIALIGILIGLKKRNMTNFIWTGILCIVLIIANAYIYFSQNSILILPILQKITFAALLIWIALINSKFGMRQHEKVK